MTAHTPLPWHHSKGTDQIIGADGSLVCEGLQWNDNGEANARLIVAAPELLEALEVIKVISVPPHHENALSAISEICSNTIAKAKEATP